MNVFKKIKQRGQVLLLYALMIPTLFFFVGITFDLSWYYLNVARMQNAADAAVLAGAQKLIEQEGTLSDYNYTNFVNGYDGSKVSPSSRNTFNGDSIAKDYVGKNISGGKSLWMSDTMTDVVTKNDLHFSSTLSGNIDNNYDILYYHVMLEEEVPHMMLGKFFPDMNAKVSSVAKITQFMKGYDLYQQVKLLEDKQTYSSWNDIYKQKNDSETAANDRIVILSRDSTLEDAHYTEEANLTDSNYLFDNLLVTTDPAAPQSSSMTTDHWAYRTYRIINIDTVYTTRDYTFYNGNSSALEKIRETNPDYDDLSNDELAELLAKDFYDPLYVRIESEPRGEPVRQIIINVNVANMNEITDRPIVLFYEGPEYDESLPVILNLNADFRGVLYAPISPVVINGNNHEFQGFVVAEKYVQLETDDNTGEDDYDDDKDKMLIDEFGNVEYKKIGGSYETVDKSNLASTYNLSAYSSFDSFNLIRLEYNLSDYLFTTEDAKMRI